MDATLDTIPFPAITICNMNQAVRKEAEDILTNGLVSYILGPDIFCEYNNNDLFNFPYFLRHNHRLL